eukprot:513798-Prorocentrum_lima.AAC.1
MTSSLVGSEMCIRDSMMGHRPWPCLRLHQLFHRHSACFGDNCNAEGREGGEKAFRGLGPRPLYFISHVNQCLRNMPGV